MSPAVRAATLLAVTALSACASSKLTDVWVAPQPGPRLHDVVVVAMRKDATRRRLWEDALASALTSRGVRATPSYTLIPGDAPAEAQLRERLRGSRYDGVLVVRRIGRQERSFYVPGRVERVPVGAFYHPFWRTYLTMYDRVYTPGYVDNQTVISYETTLWTMSGEGTLIWAGRSETTDPSSPQAFTQELSNVVLKRMAKDGVI